MLAEYAPQTVASALPDGKTALHMAAENRQDATLKVLLDHGAPLHMVDYHQRTPLHVAAETGTELAVVRLVGAGADVNARDDEGLTPISAAINMRRDGLAPFLAPVARLDRLLPDGMSLLHLAAHSGSIAWTRELVARIEDDDGGAGDHLLDEQDEHNWAPLHYAASRGFVDIVGLLLEAGAYPEPVDLHGWTPLHVAVRHGHRGCLGLLLAAGVDDPPARPVRRGRSTFTPAAWWSSAVPSSRRRNPWRDWLVRDIPDGGQPSALLLAASNGDAPAMRLLLQRLDTHRHESRRLGADALVRCFGKALSLGDADTLRLLVPRVSAAHSRARETVAALRWLVEHRWGRIAAAGVPDRATLLTVVRARWAPAHRYRLLVTAQEAGEAGVLSLGLQMWPAILPAPADLLPAQDDEGYAAAVEGVEAERARVPDGGRRGSMWAYVLVRKRKRPEQSDGED